MPQLHALQTTLITAKVHFQKQIECKTNRGPQQNLLPEPGRGKVPCRLGLTGWGVCVQTSNLNSQRKPVSSQQRKTAKTQRQEALPTLLVTLTLLTYVSPTPTPPQSPPTHHRTPASPQNPHHLCPQRRPGSAPTWPCPLFFCIHIFLFH